MRYFFILAQNRRPKRGGGAGIRYNPPTTRKAKTVSIGLAAAAAALAAFWLFVLVFMPAENPDLYWHLNAGRWIAAHAAVPRIEFWSWTMAGTPWVDFEWLTQVLLYGAHAAAGCAGVCVLRALFLGGACLLTARVLALQGFGPVGRALGACAFLTVAVADLGVRADNVSVFLFAATLERLESFRLGRVRRVERLAAAFAGAYFLWGNLHLGWCYGLALIAAYGAGALAGRGPRPRDFGLLFIAAALAAQLTPYGPGGLAVLADHLRALPRLHGTNMEWAAADVTQP
ncbi:MAG TPA: hypothetical protein VNI01_16720, partial [Elusimicrobiota bacterium]|nr:hypothetical protein [Elusimicrobiota bacterium]